MKKKTLIPLFILLFILTASLAAILLPRGSDAHILRISRDGEVVEEIDLRSVSEAYTFTLTDASGSNEIEVSPEGARVISADCPDQICVKSGLLTPGGRSVICLPHKLVLELVED